MNSLVIGRRGLGKSTLAEFLANQETDNKIIFDPNNQFKDAHFVTSDLEELKDHLEEFESDDENSLFVAYVPTGEVELEWDRFAPAVWSYGDYALIIDEAHWLQKPSYINPWLSRFIRQAPRRERGDENPVDIIMTAHRPQDIHGVVLSQCDYEYLFRTTKRRDLEYIEKEFEFDSDEELLLFDGRQRPPIVQVVRSLRTPPEGRDVVRIPIEEPQNYEVWTDAERWHVDIRKPPKNSLDNLIPNGVME